MKRTLFAGLLLAAATTGAQADSTSTAMYFHSQVRDAPECTATATDGTITYPEAINSPAASCADTFAWASFLETIQAEFWNQWANDETVWVADPKPLCSSDGATDCCFVNIDATPQVGYRDASGKVREPDDIGAPGKHCPYIPADWGGSTETTFAGGKPGNSHNATFLRTLDPARVARQGQVEVVYRSDNFVRYTTEQELYSKPGLAKLYARVAGEAKNSRPHRPTGQSVTYPSSAMMFKVAWIDQETMVALGYVSDHDNDAKTPPQNPDRPYITQKIRASSDDGKTYHERIYYLASVAASSKALPGWHWFAFEHAENLGRCDFTGCNDSFGALHEVTVGAPLQPEAGKTLTTTFESNFIAPNIMDDALNDNQDLFDLGKRYPAGEMTKALTDMFDGMGIGTGDGAVDPENPDLNDPAWKSYRLKGTQTQFTNFDGYPTILGSSINEGGFVNSASCISCHVQASVNADGGNGAPGVGASGRLNNFGIGSQVSGEPVTGDFYDRGTANRRAVQTDFVWGTLFAKDPETK
ncbi:MAG: hypothetical protein HOL07_05350 [Rhodospirillaceae bacterium]|mgnify:FL=1|nr:hypothetical protein [Rhodospirillaceae bacterium]MBT5357756.1 hypothetical protein [Rhodospirillaceae bacterium]MBT5771158.1 hypothetical protein [Rhodospirillaceae bacterium]MBT7365060.1 hypothetical protein [Rhodospirillaceae bacterium]